MSKHSHPGFGKPYRYSAIYGLTGVAAAGPSGVATGHKGRVVVVVEVLVVGVKVVVVVVMVVVVVVVVVVVKGVVVRGTHGPAKGRKIPNGHPCSAGC